MRDYSLVLKGILSAAASALNAERRSPGRTELTPGTLPAWDDCCEGQLYLRTIEIFPSGSPFPAIDTQQRGVGVACSINMLAVHLGLGVIRCAATLDDNGAAPSPQAVTDDADEMLDDMATLLDVIACTAPTIPGVQQLKIDRWTPQGVEGGCHGGEWGFYIAVDPCLCQEATP